jgi:hypothetical protein
MDARIGDLAQPPRQVCLELGPGGEAAAGDGVALDVADAALVLALGPGPVGGAGLRPEAPVAGEGVEAVVEDDLARPRVVVRHQRLGVVEQDLLGHAAEVPEGAIEPVEPGALPLVPEGRDEIAPRVAERRHEQVHPDRLVGDRHEGRAEVDLQLAAGRRLEPDRRPGLGDKLAPQLLHRPLDGAQRHPEAMLALELLVNDVGVAAMPPQPLGQPRLEPVQGLRPARAAVARPGPGLEVAAHRHVAAAELLADPSDAPAQSVEPDHRRHLVRRPHRLPPRLGQPRRGSQNHLQHRDLLSPREGPVPRVARGPDSHVA